MKKLLSIALLLLGASMADAKSWITSVSNNSPYYMKFHSTDPSAKNMIVGGPALAKTPYILAPGQTIKMSDTVIPWRTFGAAIRVSVSGVSLNGQSFEKSNVVIQEDNNRITVEGMGSQGNEVATSKNGQYTITADKNGKVSLK